MISLQLFTTFLVVSLPYSSPLSILTLQNEERGLDIEAERYWGEWGEWQPCSRSCGGGVTHMLRRCLKLRSDGIPGCVGPNRKYSSCSIQDCPDGSVDFREEQCSFLNNQTYGGRKHQWKPYVGDSVTNPCELYCQPNDGSFFTKLSDKVVDGTRCRTESYDVCVDGACQDVGCDMMLGSGLQEDACKECGGDGSSCYQVNGVINSRNLLRGYTDIIAIPSGATNIEIDEYRASRNYLAIRNSRGDYVLNGGWKITGSRAIEVAGTTMHYRRKLDRQKTPESLHAAGPTTNDIHIALVVQERNKGIRYSFYLPQGTQDPNGADAEWVVAEWDACSRQCGGGTQSRRLSCRKNGKKASNFHCRSSPRPQRRRQCNADPCIARWHVANWTDCSESCNGGVRFRQVYCTETQSLSDSSPRLVQEVRCESEDNNDRPVSQERCNDIPCPGWQVGNWSACSTTCGVGRQGRQVRCLPGARCSANSAPSRQQECNRGPCAGIEWLVTTWSPCTERCGKGMQTRLVHCASTEGVVYEDALCRNFARPPSQKACHSTSGCTDNLQWMTGEWSECSAVCGGGMQTRKVVCSVVNETSHRTFPDDQCADVGDKPAFMRNCTRPECVATWFTGPWKACSVSCGEGIRRRRVMCLSETTFRPLQDSDCDVTRKPAAEEICSSEPCHFPEPTQGHVEEEECGLTTYGCCPDNRTPAQGWLMEGCLDIDFSRHAPTCQTTENGCCRDGIRKAMGPNHYGCPEYEICHVSFDRGNVCSQWTARWYFNPEASRCTPFWYGGCGGNRNNYASEDECQVACGRRRSSSSTGRVTSTATSTTTTTTTSQPSISTFSLRTASPRTTLAYLPNTTPSNTRSELQQSTQTVLLPAIVESVSSVWLNRPIGVLTAQECSLPPLRGPCLSRVHRWHFDRSDHSCKIFVFGGCAANINNFETRDECEAACAGDDNHGTSTSNPLPRTKCQLEKIINGFEGKRLPQCDLQTGNYRPLQCISDLNGVTYACWCVNRESGVEIDGSRRHGSIAPDCESYSNRATPCIRSRYGCCSDGVTPARDHRGRGCNEPPRIRLHRSSVYSRLSDSARLSCPAVGRPKPVVRWYKDGLEIPENHTRRSVSVDRASDSLIFANVQRQHFGSYVCEASNGVGETRRRTVRLILQEERLRFHTKPTSVTVRGGKSAVLKCRVHGNHISVKWTKDGRLLKTNNDVIIKPWGDLRITRTISQDEGLYTCIVTRSKKRISASAYITVLPPTSVEDQCSDHPDLANCSLIVVAGMCDNESYRRLCCVSCRRSTAKTIPSRRPNRILSNSTR